MSSLTLSNRKRVLHLRGTALSGALGLLQEHGCLGVILAVGLVLLSVMLPLAGILSSIG